MQLLRTIRPFFSTSNLAFRAINNQEARQQVQSAIADQSAKEKINKLAEVLLSLKNIEVQYLAELQNKRALEEGKEIMGNQVYSFSEKKVSVLEYLYQERWMSQVWKETHLLTTVMISEADQEGAKDEEETVKEIYEFELTSVDPSQKIKVIKVIRELLNLGLKEAKDIVDKAPIIMKKGKKEEGEKLKQDLSKQGCVVTLK